MDIIKELMHGNISPYDHLEPCEREREILDMIIEKDEEFLRGLSAEKRELFIKCTDLRYDLASLNDLSLFTEGFRIGARLMLAVLADN